jgi:hypothetical protein
VVVQSFRSGAPLSLSHMISMLRHSLHWWCTDDRRWQREKGLLKFDDGRYVVQKL